MKPTNKYSLQELITAWKALYNTESDTIWRDINIEVAKRMTREGYTELSNSMKMSNVAS